MSITLSYLGDLGRVRIEYAGAPAAADYAHVERSTNGITWSTIRGGEQAALSAGAGVIDDYEYEPGVANQYRVSFVNAAEIVYLGIGTAVHADNAGVTVVIPALAKVEAALLNLVVTKRNTAQVLNTPAGWTKVIEFQTITVYQRQWVTGTPDPDITVTGGAAGDTISGVITAFDNAAPGPTVIQTQSNASAQNISSPAMQIPDDFSAIGHVSHKIAEVTTSSTLSLFLNTTVMSTPTGLDQATIWQRASASSNVQSVGVQSLTITGGVAALSRVAMWAMKRLPYMAQYADTITPEDTGFWIKNLRRPNQNVKAVITAYGDITRRARTGVFDIVGRTYPVAVTDVHTGRAITITVRAEDFHASRALADQLGSGEVYLFQAQSDECPVPTMYAVIGDTREFRTRVRGKYRYIDLPLTEVAAPSAGVYPTTVTYGDLPLMFATYGALLAAEPTYSDVMDITASVDVIVP